MSDEINVQGEGGQENERLFSRFSSSSSPGGKDDSLLSSSGGKEDSSSLGGKGDSSVSKGEKDSSSVQEGPTPKEINSEEGKSTPVAKNPFIAGLEKASVSEDYALTFPEDFPPEQAQSLKELLVKSKFPQEDAQLLVDSVTKVTQELQAKQEEDHHKRCDEAFVRLKEEMGVDEFSKVNRHVLSFIKEEGLEGDPRFTSFVTSVGAYDSFKLMEKLSRSARDANYTSPPAPQSGVSSFTDLDKPLGSPEFRERFKAEDPQAFSLIQKWAKQQALLDQ